MNIGIYKNNPDPRCTPANLNKNNTFVRQKAYFAVLRLLNLIIGERKYPDMLFGDLFKSGDFSSQEKAAIAELVYGILRYQGRIDYILEHASNARISEIDQNILNIFRICTYLTAFTGGSPAGIINNAVALSSNEKKLGGFVKRTVESVIRNKDQVSFPDKEIATLDHISVYHSHPKWIVEKWLNELSGIQEVEALCQANDLPPPLTIWTNPLKIDRFQLQPMLEKEGYRSSHTPFSPYGLNLDKKEDIFKTDSFKNGFFEVQDEGSQLLALLTGEISGELVIDACAGNGGKSLFISGMMKNKGTLLAFETHRYKLANLRRRAGRAGASNIQTPQNIHEYDRLADCVFIDAPCSGMGVFRRNPDAKWRLKPEDVIELAEKQKEILKEYSRLVKPGGRLIYATCTISRRENEEAVNDFLGNNSDFYLVPASRVNFEILGKFTSHDGFFRTMPHIHNTDGFFGAVMLRNNGSLISEYK
jgi:16S rRNA (cytosine967-C5)-methyltransferase